MATLEQLRDELEAIFDAKLPTEDAVKWAYGALTGFEGDQLDEEFEIALGRIVSGTPVAADGKLEDDPIDVQIAKQTEVELRE